MCHGTLGCASVSIPGCASSRESKLSGDALGRLVVGMNIATRPMDPTASQHARAASVAWPWRLRLHFALDQRGPDARSWTKGPGCSECSAACPIQRRLVLWMTSTSPGC